jgi:LPS export ABC transporter protein LptC
VQVHQVKALRWALIALIGIVLGAVGHNYLQTWRFRARIVRQAAKILSPEMLRAGEGIEYSEYENGVQRFRIHAEKLLETRQGRNLLEGIEAFELSADGSPGNQIRSRRAEYDRQRKQADFYDEVEVDLGRDVKLHTNSLHYDLGANVGLTKDPFQFSSNQARGTGRGFSYSHDRKSLTLDGDVRFTVTRAILRPDGSAESEDYLISSERGYLSQTDHLFRFEGKARLDSSTATLAGDRIEATMSPDMKQLTSLFCAGNASYRWNSGSSDSRNLAGDRIIFVIDQASGVLQSIGVHENASFSSKAQGVTQDLQAVQIDIAFDPKSLPTSIQAGGSVQCRLQRQAQDILLTGERLYVGFVPDTGLMQDAQVSNGARMLMRADGGNGTDDLHGENIQLKFGVLQGRSVLQELRAATSVIWVSSPPDTAGPAASRRSLQADSLNMTCSEGDNSFDHGDASGNVVVAGIPASSGAPQEVRRLQADHIQFHFYPRNNRLESFDGSGHVQVAFSTRTDRGAPAESRSSSANIRAAFSGADGSLTELSQWGDFRYTDALRTANAGRSDYSARTHTLVMRESPRIVDAASGVTTGERVEFNPQDKVLSVSGRVRSTLKPQSSGQGTPFSPHSGASSPGIVTADRMQAWTDAGRVRYTGNVHLLTETTQLTAGLLEFANGGDKVQAEGDVRHLIVRPANGKDARQPNGSDRIVVRADHLGYLQPERSIHYVGAVHLNSSDADVSCDTMDAVFDASGNQIERATAAGKLQIRQSGRVATGEIANYNLDPGKFVVGGSPAQIQDPKRGKSAARRLTFFTTDDRILLETTDTP